MFGILQEVLVITLTSSSKRVIWAEIDFSIGELPFWLGVVQNVLFSVLEEEQLPELERCLLRSQFLWQMATQQQ